MIDSFRFCTSEKIFILSFLKDIFAGYRILGCQDFWSQYFRDVASLSSHLHCFWWVISGHLSLYFSVHQVSFFSGCVFKIFSLSLVFSNLIMMCLDEISLACAWGLLNFLDLWVYSLPEFGKFSTIISLNNFSTPPCLHSYRVIVAFLTSASANLNICDSFSVISWSMFSSSWLCFPFCLLWLNAGHCGFSLGYKMFLFSYKRYWTLLWDAVNYFLIIIVIFLWMWWVFFAVSGFP